MIFGKRFFLLPLSFVVLYACMYVMLEMVSRFALAYWTGSSILASSLPQLEVQGTLILVIAVLYAALRVYFSHPLFDSGYRQTLLVIPWSLRSRLPKGPVYPVWQDALCLLVLTTLYFRGVTGIACLWPMVYMFTAYSALLCATFFLTGPKWAAYSLVFLFGVPLLDFFNPVVWSVTSILYVSIAWVGLRISMNRFPWDFERIWEKFVEIFLKGNKTNTTRLPWPDNLLFYDKIFSFTRVDKSVLSLLVGWYGYLYVYLLFEGRTDLGFATHKPFWRVFVVFSIFCALFRVAMYIRGHAAPISLLARPLTGRLIIPRYDQIFVTPALAVLFAIGMPYLFSNAIFLQHILFPATLSVFVWILLMGGPSMENWRLTGAHRLRMPPTRASVIFSKKLAPKASISRIG